MSAITQKYHGGCRSMLTQSTITENCWITSPGVYKEGTGNVGDCRGWRPIENDVGTIIANSSGKVFPGRHYCDRVFKVACCK